MLAGKATVARVGAAAAPAASGREAAGKAKEGAEPFGDYPEALDEEDDDLPF